MISHCLSISFTLLLLIAMGCGGSTSPDFAAHPGCAADQAQIAVYDGAMRTLCGCAEGDQLVQAGSGGTLTCSVNAGAAVFFIYVSTKLHHQIVSTGISTFVSGQVTYPARLLGARAHVVRIAEPGTYQFHDSYAPALIGRVVVQ